jgi:N-ethylmaleimide reductase
MAPLTRGRADNPDLVPADLHARYYTQRATAGLIISEGILINRRLDRISARARAFH